MTRRFLHIALLLITFIAVMPFYSCRDMLMNRVAEKLNAKCPTRQIKGFVLNSVEYQEDTFILNLKVEDSTIREFFDKLGLDESYFYMALDLFADQITTRGSVKNFTKKLVGIAAKDDTFKTLIDISISENVNAKLVFQIGTRQKSLLITPKDIAENNRK